MDPAKTPRYVKRDYLSYSTLMSFARCPRRYFYQKSGLYPYSDQAALIYGTAMHKAVDIVMTEGLEQGIASFAALWNTDLDDDKRSLARARAQLTHYYHTHKDGRSIYQPLPPPPQTIELTEDVSPLEIPFVIDIGLPIPLAGRIDGWGLHRDTKEVWGREFKTTSRLTSSLFNGLELNPQILSYALILRTVTGKTPKGIMFEGMLIDKSKVENIIQPVYVQEHMLSDILGWLQYVGGLLLACEERGEFPKDFSGCSAYPMFYMTGSHCEYTNLCGVDDWRRLASLYDHRDDHKIVKLSTGASDAT